MSYPIHSLPRTAVGRTVRNENGFWGYDPSRNARDRSPERAADTENLIWRGDALGRRSGYSLVEKLNAPIYGIFFYGQELLIHAGDTLYRQKTRASEPEVLYQGLNPAPSRAMIHHQHLTRRWLESPYYYGWRRRVYESDVLFLSDQKNFIFYNGKFVHSVADEYWGQNPTSLMADEAIRPQYFATVPFTSVAKLPIDYPGDVDPRGDNQFSQFRCESFYVTEQADTFQLNCSRAEIQIQMPVELLIRDEEGIWHTFACNGTDRIELSGDRVLYHPAVPIAAGSLFSSSDDNRIMTWGDGKCTMAADNNDNLRIVYAVKKNPPDALNGATAMGIFGADGADNVLFLGGSAAAPGVDSFSAPDDFTCFYTTSTECLGRNSCPITGYCRLTDGRLAVLKNEPDGVNVYFRHHAVMSMGSTASGAAYQVDVFPACGGAAVSGCVAAQTVGAVGNEPIFLSDTGLFTVKSVSDTLVNLNQTIHRSKAVDSYLLNEEGTPFSICWKGYYLLCWGREALLTDGRKDNNGMLRFLKWRFSHEMTAFGKSDGMLWLGDAQGGLYCMDGSDTDAGTPFRAFWKTALPEDSGGRRMLLKKVWAAFSPDYRGAAESVVIHGCCPDFPAEISLRRLDFADWDFASVCFDGTDAPRWFSLLRRSALADSFSVELALCGGQQLKLWGIRMQYEKGGVMA